MIRIQELSTGNLYDIGHPYEGGTIQLRGQCPVLRRAGVIIIDQDKGEYQLERDLSFLFRYYDTENPPTDPEPDNPNPEPLDCSIAPPEIQLNPSKIQLNNGNTLFSCIIINNPNNYQIEFSTSVLGGLDTNGQPTGWETVNPTGGIYPIETGTGGLQNIWTRWKTCSTIKFHTYIAEHGTVDPDPEPVEGDVNWAVSSPFFVHIWGSGGENPAADQGTHESECWMLSQRNNPNFRNSLPWYGNDTTNRNVVVDVYENGVLQFEGGQIKRKTVAVNVDFLVTPSVMTQAIEYIIYAGCQGFAFLYYANDSPLKIWRKTYKELANKRGSKAILGVYALGGNRNSYPTESDQYTISINEIASDIQQGWYYKIMKSSNMVPVIYALCDVGVESEVAPRVAQLQEDITRIRSVAGITDSYNIIMTTMFDVRQYANGVFWNAWAEYYITGNYSLGFSSVKQEVESRLNSNLNDNKYAPNITCGYYEGARDWYYDKQIGASYYNFDQVVPLMPDLIQTVVNDSNSKPRPCVFVAMGDEVTEQGNGFFPTKRADQALDTRMINAFKQVRNP